jgi:hypothetical protein
MKAEEVITLYHKPALQRFGSLRDLTLVGFGLAGDGGYLANGGPDTGGTDGCQFLATGTCSRS